MTTKLIISLLLILFQVGCSMSNESDFVNEAMYVVEVLEASIEHKAFPKSERARIEEFFERELSQEEAGIQEKLISVYMAFLGKTDFKNTNSEENKTLFEQLNIELNAIDEELEAM
ncbi:hypothetical protein [Paenibacillus xylanilyticus]|uniref:hypothetical protein n=1 Tax=Paenibacillus xylanilyticus TaxID=248903 RepID=UPI0039A0CDA2